MAPPAIRATKSTSVVSALRVQDVYKAQHILQRDVALDGAGRGEDVAARLPPGMAGPTGYLLPDQVEDKFRRYDKVRRYDEANRSV